MRTNCRLPLVISATFLVLSHSRNVSGRIYGEVDDDNLLSNNNVASWKVGPRESGTQMSSRNRHATSNNNSLDNENEVQQTNSVSDGQNSLSTNSTSSGSSGYVIRMLSKAFRFLNLKQMVKNIQDGRSTPGVCMACKFSMTMVKYLIDYGNGSKDISYVITYFCKTLNVQSARVCEGYVTNILEEFVMVMSRINLSSNEICGTLLGEHCSQVNHPLHNWTLPLPQITHLRKSLLLNSLNLRWPFTERKPRYFKVLQISDIHLDPEYAEGSNAVCGEPLCCRKNSPGSDKPVRTENQAGYWGDYRSCDMPLRTIEHTFRTIRNNHPDIDYIIWTGDIPPHDIWNQTRKGNLELIRIVGDLFERYFSDIPMYPVVGNHESCPMNSFPQPEISDKYSNSWLYNTLSESWLKWLPLETRSTIEKGAYFAARAKVGLKIISLNTNFCSSQNWWILLNSTDPGQQLEWLIKQLQESENLGEMVQILGHIPPGTNDCIQMWSRNYNRIINRFSHIIKGQFFGHTHNDEFEIFYEDVSQPPKNVNSYSKAFRASNVAYIGPSITTFGNVNPGYRIYLVDEETFDIVDHHTYSLNLTEANLNRDSKPLNFRKSYSAKEAYGLKSLSAVEWHKFVMRMRTPIRMDDRILLNKAADASDLFKKFYRNIFNLSDNIGDSNKCEDENCKYEVLCRLLTATSQDHTLWTNSEATMETKSGSRKPSGHQQQQYTYNKKLLENMSTLLNYVESSRQDLLSATKSLLTAYRSEFEDGKSMQDDIVKLTQHNLELENARNKVETDLLRLREAYNRELVKNEELAERLRANEFSLGQISARLVRESTRPLSSEQRQSLLETAVDQLAKLNSITNKLTSEASIRSPISTFSSRVSDSDNTEAIAARRLSLPKRLNSSTLTYSNPAPATNRQSTNYSTATIHTHVSDKKQEHNFQEASKISFNQCHICKKSIIPLVKYFHCLNCDIKIDKNCFVKNLSIPCQQKGIKKSIKLSDLPIQKCTKPHISELIVKCCQQIEQRGADTTGLYQNLKEKDAEKVIFRYFQEPIVDNLKLHKLNVHVLCSIIIQVFNRLDESLITKKLWQDFALACGQKSSQDCDALLQLSLDKLDPLNCQTLAYFILHLKKLSTKNFGHNLSNQSLASIFGSVIVKDDGHHHQLNPRKSSATLKDNMKLFNIQNQIMQSLLEIGTERWQEIVAAKRETTRSVQPTRRKTTNFRDVLVADKMRVSFYEKLSTSMY